MLNIFTTAQQMGFRPPEGRPQILGAIVGGLDGGLALAGMPILTRSALVVMVWLALTGGAAPRWRDGYGGRSSGDGS